MWSEIYAWDLDIQLLFYPTSRMSGAMSLVRFRCLKRTKFIQTSALPWNSHRDNAVGDELSEQQPCRQWMHWLINRFGISGTVLELPDKRLQNCLCLRLCKSARLAAYMQLVKIYAEIEVHASNRMQILFLTYTGYRRFVRAYVFVEREIRSCTAPFDAKLVNITSRLPHWPHRYRYQRIFCLFFMSILDRRKQLHSCFLY